MKESVGNLSIFGGTPAFAAPVHVGAPNIGDRGRLHALIDDALDRRWLSNDGPYVREFEGRLCSMLGVDHCVATSNATSALMLLAAALDLRGEVIMPSLTFVATAHAMAWQGLRPVFCDIDPATLTLSTEMARDLIGPKTAAILAVHLWGMPSDVEGLGRLASDSGVALLFDAAHALGCSFRGRPLGSFGTAEAFSFHATKLCNAFEGGVVATNDSDLAERIVHARNFGFVDVDVVKGLGINAKMSEASAAMGLVSLESIDRFVAANWSNFEHYKTGLRGVPGIRLRELDAANTPTYSNVIVEVDTDAALPRDTLNQVLNAEMVFARRYFFPGCHRMEPYRTWFPDVGERLPVTEAALASVLSLPTGTATGSDTIDRICELIRFVVDHGDEIVHRLNRGLVLATGA